MSQKKEPKTELERISDEAAWLLSSLVDGTLAGNALIVWGAEQRLRQLLKRKSELEYGQMTLWSYLDELDPFDPDMPIDDKMKRLSQISLSLYNGSKFTYYHPQFPQPKRRK